MILPIDGKGTKPHEGRVISRSSSQSQVVRYLEEDGMLIRGFVLASRKPKLHEGRRQTLPTTARANPGEDEGQERIGL